MTEIKGANLSNYFRPRGIVDKLGAYTSNHSHCKLTFMGIWLMKKTESSVELKVLFICGWYFSHTELFGGSNMIVWDMLEIYVCKNILRKCDKVSVIFFYRLKFLNSLLVVCPNVPTLTNQAHHHENKYRGPC